MRTALLVSILLASLFAFSSATWAPPVKFSAGLIDSFPRPQPTGENTILEGPVAPDEYILGPGDEMEIGLWKEMDRREIVTVNPEGFALVRPIGPIRVAGMTLKEAEEKIRASLAPYYRQEDISVSLHSLRSFIVHVVGNVKSPGPQEVSAIQRASQAIEAAGGLTETASSRGIRLRHKNGSLERIDLVAYGNAGDLSSNPFMTDGDILEVPVATKRVNVYGAVGRPGVYELVPGESLGDLAPLFGGLLEGVDLSAAEVQRFESADPSVSRKIALSVEEALRPAPDGFLLEDGDRVFFRRNRDWHRDAAVDLQGEFVKPGRYVVAEGEDRVLDVVSRAGGFTSSAAPEEAKLLRPLFEATGPGIDKEVRFLVDQQTDRLTPEDYEFLKTYFREDNSRLVIDLESLLLRGDSTQNHLLRDGDILILPTRVDMVRVSGRVVSPGLVPFSTGKSYRFYIQEAGGFDRVADKGKVRIIKKRSGARLKPSSEVRMEPGDMIWVPPREERDWWQITRETFALAAQVATIYLVIDRTQ